MLFYLILIYLQLLNHYRLQIPLDQNKETMKQIISIHIGQAGVQIADQCWQLFCLQHNLNLSGQKLSALQPSTPCTPYLQQSQSGKSIPRALMVDLDCSTIDSLRSGAKNNCFRIILLSRANKIVRIISPEDDIWSTLDKVRKLVDHCENFQGFMIYHALAGGTGSGFMSGLLELLTQSYQKKIKMNFAIYPSPNLSTTVVEPYNAALATYYLSQYSDMCVLLDNQAIYDICSKNLDIQKPRYKNLNQMIAQVVSSITTSIRFDDEMRTNLIPHNRLHYLCSSFAPFSPKQLQFYQSDPSSIAQITPLCFSSSNMFLKHNPQKGKYLSCCLMYRGDINPLQIHKPIQQLRKQKTVQFVDWALTGFKVGYNGQPPKMVKDGQIKQVKRTCTMIGNNTSIRHSFKNLRQKFIILHQKRAFLHWYVAEGLEQGQFYQAKEELQALQLDYQQAAR